MRSAVVLLPLVLASACAPARIPCEPAEPEETCPTGSCCGDDGYCAATSPPLFAHDDGDEGDDELPLVDGSDGERPLARDDVGDGFELVYLPALRASSLAVLGRRVMLAASVEREGARDVVFIEVAEDDVSILTLAAGAGAVTPALALDEEGQPTVAVFDVDPPRARVLARDVAGRFDELTTRALDDAPPQAGDRPGLAWWGEWLYLAVSAHAGGVRVSSWSAAWYSDGATGAELGAGADAPVVVDDDSVWVGWRSLTTAHVARNFATSWIESESPGEAPLRDVLALAQHDDGSVAYAFAREAGGEESDVYLARDDDDGGEHGDPVLIGRADDDGVALAASAGGFVVVTSRGGRLWLDEVPLDGSSPSTSSLPVGHRPLAAVAGAAGLVVLVTGSDGAALLRPAL